jgi:precorrin-4 methylase
MPVSTWRVDKASTYYLKAEHEPKNATINITSAYVIIIRENTKKPFPHSDRLQHYRLRKAKATIFLQNLCLKAKG